MSADAIVHTEFPERYTVLFGADGKVIMTPRPRRRGVRRAGRAGSGR